MNAVKEFLRARLWTIFTVLIIVAATMVLWIITPSSIAFRPISWSYDRATGEATFTRVVNSSSPMHVRWSHIVYVPDGPACSAGGIRLYDQRTQVETITISQDLKRCLDTPGNVAVLSWSPLLFGVIPLRPFTMTVPAGAEIPR